MLKQSVQQGRANALWTSAGVGVGILVHVSYCLLGVALLLSESPLLFTSVQYLAAAYLAYLGVQALRTAKPQPQQANMAKAAAIESHWLAFKRGFLVNALNPKATLFSLSLFTLVIEPSTPTGVQLFMAFMALATWLWFSFLSLILSKQQVRAFFIVQGIGLTAALVILLLLAVRLVV